LTNNPAYIYGCPKNLLLTVKGHKLEKIPRRNKKMQRKNRFRVQEILLVLGSILLSSCIDLETKIDLSSEGSGTIELVYTVASALVQMGSSGTQAVSLPLPITEEDFRQSVLRIPGLTLLSYNRKDEPEKSVITARLRFSSIEAVNLLFGGLTPVLIHTTEGQEQVLELLVAPGTPGGLDPKTKELVQAFFSTYSLRFQVKVPSSVKRTSLSEATVEGNTARFTIPILQALDRDTALKWRIVW
jgi:hypothetical protein